ncbi:MAG: tetratricopeptide repeat protein [Deltaproteobacteria bacterium]|jgi:tetratricopeptide (TPR) repeat protein|nr:tetratricopeptide repeat protein [Deltaproteobacteria bacterium]
MAEETPRQHVPVPEEETLQPAPARKPEERPAPAPAAEAELPPPPPRPVPQDRPAPSPASAPLAPSSLTPDDLADMGELTPSMAASSGLKTFAQRLEEEAREKAAAEAAKKDEEEQKARHEEAIAAAATTGALAGMTAGAASVAAEAAGPSFQTTVHSGADGIATLDLTPPGDGQAPAKRNAVARAFSNFFGGMCRLFKRIPPVEDIFDMVLAGLGFQRKPASMLRRAQTLAAKGRHADAIKWFRDILYLRPLTIAAYDGLGRVYFRMGLTEEANREFTIADSLERLVNNRDDLEAACSLAQALIERKQAKMAASLLEPVLIAHFYTPTNQNILKKMGLVYAELRATKKMHQVYEAGLLQHPDDHEFYILKGNLEVKLGKIASGEKLIRWGRLLGRLKENPQDINANMAMGELCIKENRTEEGLAHLREASQLSPENTGIRWRLFNIYQKQGNYPEALRYFQEVISIEPENEELRYKLAEFYRRNRHFEQSFQIYKTMVLKHPRDPRPQHLMAGILKDMGDSEEAEKAEALAKTLAIGLKEEPDHRETVDFMKYLFSINASKEALAWLEKGLARWPYHGELIITKVKIPFNEYRYREAVNLLKRLIYVRHDLAEKHMWMALCYRRLGNNMAALAEAQLATRLP